MAYTLSTRPQATDVVREMAQTGALGPYGHMIDRLVSSGHVRIEQFHNPSDFNQQMSLSLQGGSRRYMVSPRKVPKYHISLDADADADAATATLKTYDDIDDATATLLEAVVNASDTPPDAVWALEELLDLGVRNIRTELTFSMHDTVLRHNVPRMVLWTMGGYMSAVDAAFTVARRASPERAMQDLKQAFDLFAMTKSMTSGA